MKPRQIALLILLAFVWGSYYVASQEAVKGLSVFSVGIVIRFLTMILLIIIMWRRNELKLLLRTKGIIARLLLIGCLGYLLDLTAFVGLSMSAAGTGTALLKCDILFVNIISMIIYKEHFSKYEWGFTFLMLFGVFLVLGVRFQDITVGNKGDIFFILSALFVSINAFVIKSVQLDKNNPAKDDVIAFYNNFVTMILFTISSFVMGTFSQLEYLRHNKELLLAVVLAGIGQTLVYILYYFNLRRHPVWIVKVFLLLMPIVASFLSYLLFGQTMVRNQYIGVGIVLLGALGILIEQKKRAG